MMTQEVDCTLKCWHSISVQSSEQVMISYSNHWVVSVWPTAGTSCCRCTSPKSLTLSKNIRKLWSTPQSPSQKCRYSSCESQWHGMAWLCQCIQLKSTFFKWHTHWGHPACPIQRWGIVNSSLGTLLPALILHPPHVHDTLEIMLTMLSELALPSLLIKKQVSVLL